MDKNKDIFNESFKNKEERERKGYHANITLRMQNEIINNDNFVAILFGQDNGSKHNRDNCIYDKGAYTAMSGNILDLAMANYKLLRQLSEHLKNEKCPKVRHEIFAILNEVAKVFLEIELELMRSDNNG